MPQGPYYLGIDLGGTNVKAGVVTHSGESLSKTSTKTEAERGPDVGIANMLRAAREAVTQAGLSMDEIVGVGLATPGTMDIPGGMLLEPPNLPGWHHLPIRQRIADGLKKQTVLQNDANSAAYGEFWIGGGREAKSLVFWTLGTGIGCGIILGDVIIEGEHSHGAECGHIVIQMDEGRLCDTGQYGTLEAYCGGKSLVRRCLEKMHAGEKTVLHHWIDEGKELSPLLMAKAAEQGDALAEGLIMDVARCMGVGTTTLMHTIDPDMVLFGGAMNFGGHDTELGRRFLQRIRHEVKIRAFPVPYAKTKIDFATLGGDAGYIGAAGCARLKFGSKG